MNKLFILLIFFSCIVLNLAAEGLSESVPVEILKVYSGMASFGFNPAGEFGSTEPLIIRSETDYANLIEMIPLYEMSPSPPQVPSKDPLLSYPAIDFNTHMLLVIFSHNENIFTELKIESVEITGSKMIVTTWYDIPDPHAYVAKIIDYGFYYAVLVPTFDGEIVFE